MIRIVSIIVATLLFCYIVFVSFFFRESRQKELCRDLQVVVVDSLDKHFVSGEGVICQEAPDDAALDACKDLGKQLAAL